MPRRWVGAAIRMPSNTARWAGATKASGLEHSTVASSNCCGYWTSTWSSWRSAKTTGSRRSGTGMDAAASPGAGSGTSSVLAGRRRGVVRVVVPHPAGLANLRRHLLHLDAEPAGDLRVYSGRMLGPGSRR